MQTTSKAGRWSFRCARRAYCWMVFASSSVVLASCGPIKPTAVGPMPGWETSAAITHAPQSHARTLDDYKRDAAQWIYRANATRVFGREPPPTLRAVVVRAIRVDARGNPGSLSVSRSNGYTNLEKIALQSVYDAAPLPAPNHGIAPHGTIEYVETWLSRDDGRFQIRSLAKAQAAGPG